MRASAAIRAVPVTQARKSVAARTRLKVAAGRNRGVAPGITPRPPVLPENRERGADVAERAKRKPDAVPASVAERYIPSFRGDNRLPLPGFAWTMFCRDGRAPKALDLTV